MFLTEEEAKKISDKILSYSKADSATVNLSGGLAENVRFAVNTVTTCGSSDKISAEITSNFGKKSGSVTITSLDDDVIRDGVKKSEEIAQLSPANDEFMPPLGPQSGYLNVKEYFESTANATPEERAETVSHVLQNSRQRDLISAGYFETNSGFETIGTSNGLFAYHKKSELDFSTTSRTPDGTGSSKIARMYADLASLKYEELTKTVMDRAVLTRNPVEMKPGRYTVILEKMASCDMIGNLFWYMNKRNADEGRSFFSDKTNGNKIGQKVLSDKVTIYTDPTVSYAPSSPFNGEGIPNIKTSWYENGVLKNLYTGRYWAQKTSSPVVPFPANIIMNGSDKSLEDLIKSTDKGILVIRLWYIRSVDPRSILLTGLTRDGIFYVENGEVKYPVKNFRFNESPANMLSNVVDMSKAEKVVGSETGSSKIVVPDLKVEEFNFSSVSDAV